MTKLEKLIELLEVTLWGNICNNCHLTSRAKDTKAIIHATADNLIRNGMSVPLYRPGDTIYVVTECQNLYMDQDRETGAYECPYENECSNEDGVCNESDIHIFESRILELHWINSQDIDDCEVIINNFSNTFTLSDFNKDIFLTKEDAEHELAKRLSNKDES